MQFFLHEIVARLVALYLGYDSGRKLWNGLRERKVVARSASLFDWSGRTIHRDVAPVQYWIQMGVLTFALLACAAVAVFGWWRGKT